ncbi:unnamed protein product [Macrosiphum euphorbiae]|uniref:Uncharacterized protein n=1 Tax=Macrosiphum euphorbiae TaxID=13131 RepID=A0AAV0W0X5_9HEMI|nr:unnamed protein product [Macrosiphum euphorbiae]
MLIDARTLTLQRRTKQMEPNTPNSIVFQVPNTLSSLIACSFKSRTIFGKLANLNNHMPPRFRSRNPKRQQGSRNLKNVEQSARGTPSTTFPLADGWGSEDFLLLSDLVCRH